MSTLKQAARVDGQTISNLDPDMVITLDPHEGVQISSKTEDTITYSFLKEVDKDTVYDLNLTFVYKDKYKLVVPMAFTNQKVKPKFNMNVEWITEDSELVGSDYNNIYFKVTDDDGTPLEGVTLKKLNVKSNPDRTAVVAGFTNQLVDPKPGGIYAINVRLGHLTAPFKVSMILSKDGFDFTIPDKTYNNPGTEIKLAYSPTELFATDESKEVEITVTQDRSLSPNAPVEGKLTGLKVTGGMEGNLADLTTDATGKCKITLVPNGKIEDIVLTGTFVSNSYSQTAEINQAFKVNKDTLTVELLTDEDLGYLKKATVVAHVLNSKGEYLHQPGRIVNSTVTPVPANDVVTNVPGEFTQGTADTSIYTMIVDVGYLPGTVTIVPELTIAGVKYDVTSKLEFKTEGSPVEVSRVNAVIDPFKNTMMGIFFTRQVKIDGETSISFGTKVVSQKSSDGLKINTPYAFLGKGNASGFISSEVPNTKQTLTFSVSEEIQGILYTYDDLVLEVTVRDGVKEEIIATPQADLKIMQVNPDNVTQVLPCYLEVKFNNTVGGPVTDAELISVKTTNIPESGSGIFNVSDSLIKGTGDTYKLEVQCDKGVDSVLFDMVIKSNGKEYTIKQFSVNVTKPALRVDIFKPISMLPEGSAEVTFDLALKQANWSGIGASKPMIDYNSDLDFSYEDVTITDNAEFVTKPGAMSGNPRTSKFKLKAKATEGTIKINGNIVAADPKLGKQGPLELIIPIGIAKELTVEPVTPLALSEGDNKVEVAIKYKDGTPATGLTCYYDDLKDGEKANNVYSSYNHLKEIKDRPGVYGCTIGVGWAEGTITPVWYMNVEGLSYALKGPTYTAAGTDPIVTQADATIVLDDQQHTTYFQVERMKNPVFPEMGKDPLEGKCELINIDGPLTVIGSITREPNNGRFIINCETKGEKGTATVKVKFTSTEYLTKYSREIDLPINIIPPPPILTDLVTDYKMKLWEEKELSYDVKIGTDSVKGSVTDVVCTNNDDIKVNYEFYKNTDGNWAFKAIKADTTSPITAVANLEFKVTTNGEDYILPATINLETEVNDGSISTERFDVEIK